MNDQAKILLCRLFERTSAKGTRYFTGRLAAAKVVVFQGEPTEDGTPTWNVYLSEGSQQRDGGWQRSARAGLAGGGGSAQDGRSPSGQAGERAATGSRSHEAATAAQTGAWPRMAGKTQDFDDLDSSIPF